MSASVVESTLSTSQESIEGIQGPGSGPGSGSGLNSTVKDTTGKLTYLSNPICDIL